MGKKYLYISSIKLYVNFFGNFVKIPLSPLGYGKALSSAAVIGSFGTSESRNLFLASVCL